MLAPLRLIQGEETCPGSGVWTPAVFCHQQQMSCWDPGILWDGPEVLTAHQEGSSGGEMFSPPLGGGTPLRCVGHFLPSLHSLWHGGGCNGPFHLYPHLCESCNGYRRPIYLLFERDVFLEQANSVFFQFDCLINAVLLAY